MHDVTNLPSTIQSGRWLARIVLTRRLPLFSAQQLDNAHGSSSKCNGQTGRFLANKGMMRQSYFMAVSYLMAGRTRHDAARQCVHTCPSLYACCCQKQQTPLSPAVTRSRDADAIEQAAGGRQEEEEASAGPWDGVHQPASNEGILWIHPPSPARGR